MIIRLETPIRSIDPKWTRGGSFRLIPVGKGKYAYVSNEDYDYLRQFRWTVKMSHSKPYVVRRVRVGGKEQIFRMHRDVMQTRKELQCHHINLCTYDCRRTNLVNLTPHNHQLVHSSLRILEITDTASYYGLAD